jgi:hypothetical protein
MASKLLEFIWYFIKDTVGDVGGFFKYVTREKTWVAIWGLLVIISFVAVIVSRALGQPQDYRIAIFTSICFVLFYMTYQWRIFSERYIHEQREKYIKKPNKEERR